jgi:hypothetical protein
MFGVHLSCPTNELCISSGWRSPNRNCLVYSLHTPSVRYIHRIFFIHSQIVAKTVRPCKRQRLTRTTGLYTLHWLVIWEKGRRKRYSTLLRQRLGPRSGVGVQLLPLDILRSSGLQAQTEALKRWFHQGLAQASRVFFGCGCAETFLGSIVSWKDSRGSLQISFSTRMQMLS